MKKIIVLFFIIISSTFAGVIKVPSDYANLQGAIDVAVDGDTILVANGTYATNCEITGKNISIISENGQEVTILDGEYTGSIFYIHEEAEVLISGFKFINGYGKFLDLNENGMYFLYGGGIIADNSSITVTDCKFSGNIVGYTNDNSNGGGYGGAIALYKSSLTSERCRFENNQAWYPGGGRGGAIYTWESCTVDLNQCEFYGNKAGVDGGAVSLTDNTLMTATWCSFVNNLSGTGQIPLVGQGGAINADNYINLYLINCTLSNNLSDYEGPAIHARRYSKLIIVNTLIWNHGDYPIEFGYNYGLNLAYVDYSNIEHGQDGIKANDNATLVYNNSISDDPEFVQPGISYEIASTSPCVNKGVADYTYSGNVLIAYDADQYSGTAPDIGAYEVGMTTDIPEPEIIKDYYLSQNYPNPFNPSTVIRYSVPAVDALSSVEVHISLKIYDILGNEVATIVNENQPAGNYEVTFNAKNLSSGIYFYKLQTSNGFMSTRKLVLLK